MTIAQPVGARTAQTSLIGVPPLQQCEVSVIVPSGQIVIWQPPNLPILIWVSATWGVLGSVGRVGRVG